MRKKKHNLTVRLIKEGLSAEQAISIKSKKFLDKYEITEGLNGSIYILKQSSKPPRWLYFLRGLAAKPIDIETKNSKAIMFIEAGGRLFAFTFGQGYHLLDPNSYEYDFGLRVSLNAIDADKLRSVDAKTIDERILNTRRQTSKFTPIESFGLDMRRDLLRAATGAPRDIDLAERLSGADGLSFVAKFDFKQIARKCKQLLEEYKKTTYQKRFSLFDHLRPVKDKQLISNLDDVLLNSIQNQKVENLFLAPPDIIDLQGCDGFYFSRSKGETDTDLKIENYWHLFKNTHDMTLNNLKTEDVFMIDGEFERNWPIYRCVVFETKLHDELFVIIEGKWFKISTNFANEVDNELKKVLESDIELPPAKNGEREDVYLARTAKGRKDLALMDKKLVSIGESNSPIEICDLFAQKKFIHVKKRTSSATLSHLFAQGKNSAITFLNSIEYRNKVKSTVSQANPDMAKYISNDRPQFNEYEVTYAIITGVTETDWRFQIPFFSRLSLIEACKELTNLGFDARIKKISKID